MTTGSPAVQLDASAAGSASADAPRPTAGAELRRTWLFLAALAALSVLSRLPQLTSPNLLADGDECTLGMMALHVAQGKEFPIFFYGQHYGFSPVETVLGAASFLIAGPGAIPLKLAMLTLWTAGVWFLFLALSRRVGPRRSFWITAVLILTPAWAVWSMKARGGYLTSFTATSALAWLLARERAGPSAGQWILAAVLTVTIYLAQPLWLPGILPIVVAALVARRRWTYAAIYVAATAAGPLLVRTSGGPARRNLQLAGSLPGVAHQIYVNLTGSYYLASAVRPPGPITKGLAIVWCGLLAAAALMQLYRLASRRYLALSHLLFLSVALTLLAEWVVLRGRDARYLLPFSTLLIVLVAIELLDLVDRRLLPRRLLVGLTGAALLLGSFSMHEFRRFSYLWTNPPNSLSEAARLQQVVSDLKAHGVRNVFAMNGLLEWQLMFYGNEQEIARYPALRDRYPPYVHRVDQALANGDPIAVVGYTNRSGAPGCWDVPICTGGIEGLVPDPNAIVTVDDKYFVYVGAKGPLLQDLGFRLQD